MITTSHLREHIKDFVYVMDDYGIPKMPSEITVSKWNVIITQ